MCNELTVREYLSAGKNLTTLNGKVPTLTNWTTKTLSDDKLLSYDGNLGWVIGDGDLVIDVDPKNGGNESWEKLNKILNLEGTVTTPSGGLHIYLKGLPAGKYKKNLREYPGIDFLTKGSQCVITSSSTDVGEYCWADEDFGQFEQGDVPDELVALIARDAGSVGAGDDDLGDFDGLVGNGTHSEDEVAAWLEKIDNNVPNDEWVKVGMALKWWHPIDGLAMWEKWSQGGETYREGETAKRWRSFNGTEVTIGSLVYMAKEGGFESRVFTIEDYVERVAVADERTLRVDLCVEIKGDLTIDPEGRNRIAVNVQKRLHELTEVKPPIGICRDLVTPKMSSVMDQEGVPPWCEKYVYVNTHSAYVHATKLKVLKPAAFNLKHGKNVPADQNGNKQSATGFVADFGLIGLVDTMNYLPMYDDRVVDLDGIRVLNSFNKASVPQEADEFTEAGEVAIELVKAHLKFLCGNKKEARILLQWLAHQVQFPGRQILWAPVIQSIPGAGKSFIATMLRYCLGVANVNVVAPAQVSSQFNGWAVGVTVNVLEELRVQGHNRFEALNAVKPLITDEIIQVNEKGIAPYSVRNTANYICFTNYKDALPLDSNDRRWWVIFAPIESLDDVEDYVGEPASDYFPRLFDALRTNGAEIRKWMLEYDISGEFMNTKKAPMTDHKEMMIATEEASLEGYVEAKEMIKEGGTYYNMDCISSSDLFYDMMVKYPNLDIQTTKRNLILKKLGYLSVPNPVKIDGKTRRVWVKKKMDNEEIRKRLEK